MPVSEEERTHVTLAKLKTCLSTVWRIVAESRQRIALEKSQTETMLWIYSGYLKPFHSLDILKIKFKEHLGGLIS